MHVIVWRHICNATSTEVSWPLSSTAAHLPATFAGYQRWLPLRLLLLRSLGSRTPSQLLLDIGLYLLYEPLLLYPSVRV